MRRESRECPAAVLLFDLGGVVIDIDFERAYSLWGAAASLSSNRIRSRFRFDIHYERHERGEVEASEYFESLRGSLGVELSDEQFLEGWNSIFVGQVAGIEQLLERAADELPIYAFTNSNVVHQREWSARFAPLLSCFSRVFVSSELGTRKPEAEAFRAVCEAIGVEPELVLFFDDSAENVAGAKAMGMQAVQVTSIADVRSSLHSIGLIV